MTETDYRVVLCEVCDSEGRLVDEYYGDRPCKWCEGTGGEVIEVQPIEQDDLMELESHDIATMEAIVADYEDALVGEEVT